MKVEILLEMRGREYGEFGEMARVWKKLHKLLKKIYEKNYLKSPQSEVAISMMAVKLARIYTAPSEADVSDSVRDFYGYMLLLAKERAILRLWSDWSEVRVKGFYGKVINQLIDRFAEVFKADEIPSVRITKIKEWSKEI